MEFNKDEHAIIVRALEFFLSEIKREQMKSKPGMLLYESCEEQIKKVKPVYEKALLIKG